MMPSLIRPFSNGSSSVKFEPARFRFFTHKLSWVIQGVPRELLQKKMTYRMVNKKVLHISEEKMHLAES